MNINGYFSLVISFFFIICFSLESGRHSYNPKCQLRGISWHVIVFWSLSTPAWSWYANTTSTGICVWKLACIGVVLRGTRHPKSMGFTLRKECSLEYTWHNFWSIGFSFLISTGQFAAYRNANSWEVETMVSRKTNPAVSPVINPNDHLHLVSNTSRKKCLVIIGFNCVECLEL